MKATITHKSPDFDSYRAARVKSMFNAENGHTWQKEVDIDLPDAWQIGLVVGTSGSGKTSLGKQFFGKDKIYDPYNGWSFNRPIVEDIAPDGDFNAVTAALAGVGLGDVPSWLRSFYHLSNGQQFRAGLARLLCSPPDEVVIDEFTSVVDRQIAKVGALAFGKAWRRTKGKKAVLLSCHYDVIEWLQPDWVYNIDTGELKKKSEIGNRPKIELSIWKVNQSYWKLFKEHYYLDLPMPPAAEYYIGVVDGEPVAHVAVSPLFTAKAYRATRLVVMPEWQGAGVGLKFLNEVCKMMLDGKGRKGHKFGTFFHTTHPQLCAALRRDPHWIQTGAKLYGSNKKRSMESIRRTGNGQITGCGYGGHFRAVQAFKYIGI